MSYRSRTTTLSLHASLFATPLHIKSNNCTTVGARQVYLHFEMKVLVAVIRRGCRDGVCHGLTLLVSPGLRLTATLKLEQTCLTASTPALFRSKTLQKQKDDVNICFLILFLRRGAAFDSEPGQLHPVYLRFSICRRGHPLL